MDFFLCLGSCLLGLFCWSFVVVVVFRFCFGKYWQLFIQYFCFGLIITIIIIIKPLLCMNPMLFFNGAAPVNSWKWPELFLIFLIVVVYIFQLFCICLSYFVLYFLPFIPILINLFLNLSCFLCALFPVDSCVYPRMCVVFLVSFLMVPVADLSSGAQPPPPLRKFENLRSIMVSCSEKCTKR